MSKLSGTEAILSQAAEQENKYDWLRATESYENALGFLPEHDYSKRGEICERLSYAVYRAAMQAESHAEFMERMQQARANYEKAKELYKRTVEPVTTSRALRCDAMILYMEYWLASKASEKKRLLDESWILTKEALNAFDRASELLEYGKTCNQLSSSAVFAFTLESDFQLRKRIIKEAVEYGEQAIKFLSTSGDSKEFARACAKTVVSLCVFGYYFQDVDEREKYCQEAMDCWLKAKEISEEVAMTESLYPVFGGQLIFGLEGTDEALANYTKTLDYARRARDKFMMGCALDWLMYHTVWKLEGIEDPDKWVQLSKEAFQYGENARQQFSKISFTSPRGDLAWIEASPADYCSWLAEHETDMRKRRDLLEKAAKAAPDMLRKAEDSAYPEVIMYAHGILGMILSALAKAETNLEEKKRLLEKALEHRSKCVTMTEQLTPFLYWNRGIQQSAVSRIESDLADLTDDLGSKKNMLQEATFGKEQSLKLLVKELTFVQSKRSTPTSLFADLGRMRSEYGDLSIRLYGFTNNPEQVKKAIEAFKEATESFRRLDLRSRMAECSWKAAQAYDTLGEHMNAAKHFDLASSDYKSAAANIPPLKDFYQDHALYMQAWSEIEKARHHHTKEEYGAAEEYFEKAAGIHKSLKKWTYLAPNYFALAQVERAEELSRKDQSEEALQTFEGAAILFKETKQSLQNELVKIDSTDEKRMVTSMVKATELRHQYCMARSTIEEARILDKKGDHHSSSEKYSSAVQILEKMTQCLESEQERREFKLFTALSEAWAKMTQAEAEANPSLYTEASQLFEKARDFTQSEKIKMLVLGHSRFCKALEAGTRFADTGTATSYKTALQHLESAAKYYVKAGFESASEYARATGLLLDAYLHMNNAKKEDDPEKKARLYMMAEKVLQTSAGSFMKAEHPEKREQVLKLLEKAKEERELAVSLSEVLHAPSIVSATATFASPAPTKENAVGLERFEQADVQANIITRQKELKVGENLELEIELVNAGKGRALLIKVAEIIPQNFDLIEKPENYRLEDSYLNMKGKRLDPLKTEELRIILKPKTQGVFQLKPKILYLDENGKYKSHEPQPMNITVKELGIKGWLKG